MSGSDLDAAVSLARGKRHIEFFTGAGMSAESGLNVYRNDKTGLWENVDPTDMASIDAWARDPAPMWAWYLWRATQARCAQPNAGHKAIAQWNALDGCDVHVSTQNIDDLHERGGMSSHSIDHLHGSLFEFRCTICSRPYKEPELPRKPCARMDPPSCPLCHSPIRPGIVWFGEPLPPDVWADSEQHMAEADLVVIVGTSGVVQPAASLPVIAYQCGVPILELTPAPTELTRFATVSWTTTAATGLPALVHALT